ncbi:MAG: GAF domain-containing protein, partial [Candidatus Sulfotelmatobacter sp.]
MVDRHPLNQDPMMPPESSEKTPSWNSQALNSRPLTDGSAALSLEKYSDVAQIAKTLSEFGGGAVALDLALDLVLNEAVEQARLATGATGAAVALARDGEMVCRATTGDNAPELGVRVETASGLSGECLRSGEAQHCADTENDPRVDAESCRQLGIRSVLLVPLNDGRGTFGILEAFSSRPNTFGERDINTLGALAGRIVASKRAVEEGTAGATNPSANGAAAIGASVEEQDSVLDEVSMVLPERKPELKDAMWTITQNPGKEPERPRRLVAESPGESPVEAGPDAEAEKSSDIWTTVLVVLVIAAAVSLGVLIGWHGALQGSVQPPPAQPGSAQRGPLRPSTFPAVAVAANSSFVNPAPNTAVPRSSPTGDATGLSQTSPQARRPADANSTGSGTGGLTVTENGKVIYRLRGKSIPDGAASSSSSTQSNTPRLLHRVDPKYPAEARNKHMQGAVVLDVQVLGNGSVG